MSVTLRQRGPRGPLELPPADRRPLMDDAAFEEMEELRELCLAPFDADDPHHLAMLETLWRSALPDKPFERLSRHWADTFGFQGRDPATDVRGGGFVALQHLWRFAATSPTHPGALVRSGRDHHDWHADRHVRAHTRSPADDVCYTQILNPV